MATQTHPYLVITDGTTTVTIQDGSGGATNYPLVRDGWAPAIAGLRASPLAGYTPYDDVVEQLSIEINGSTASAALANLATLTKLLDQAARWYRGEAVTAVLIKFAPAGSTVSATATPLQAAILGGGAGSAVGVRLAPKWSDVSFNYVIEDVTLTLTRRGLWLLPGAAAAGSPAAADNGEIITADLGASSAVDIHSPTEVSLTNVGYDKSSSFRFLGGFLLLGQAVGGTVPITILAAEDAASGVYTSVAGGLNARNTNVLRYTPGVTTEVESAGIALSMPAASDLVAIFINVKPSATVSFSVRARYASELRRQYTPFVTVPANSAQYPYWVFLGVVAKKDALASLYLNTTAASASSSLDIDTIVVCDVRATQILGIIGPGDSEANGVIVTTGLAVDHNLLDLVTPTVIASGSAPVPYAGSAVFSTKDRYVYGLLLATGGGTGSAGQEYRQANTGTDAVLQNAWTVTRTPGYLVPQ